MAYGVNNKTAEQQITSTRSSRAPRQANATGSSFKTLPVELQSAHVRNGIVTMKNRALSPIAHLFIEYAREVAKPLAH